MRKLNFLFPILVLSLSLSYAQTRYKITGQIFCKEENTPLLAVTVLVEEMKMGTYSTENGAFQISGIPGGIYTIKFSLIGHKTYIQKVKVPLTEPLIIKMEDGAVDIKEVTVTGNPFASDPKEISQSILSLKDLDLQIRKGANLGETLNFQPGISIRSNGTATYRPVIRGFNNNRILILEDGLRMGDLSNTSDDHSVSSDGSSAEKIEVVRGPGSLLYGSNAIGGVINVLTQSIPNTLSNGIHGEVSVDGATVNLQTLQTVDLNYGIDKFEFHSNVFNRKSKEYTDAYDNKVLNSDAKAYGTQFGFSYIPVNGVYGLSFSSFNNEYGLPFNPSELDGEGPVFLKMKKYEMRMLLEQSDINSFFSSYSLKAGYEKYSHDEINKATGETGTSFGMESFSSDLSINHNPIFANSQGVIGLWMLRQKYTVSGEEAFTPNADYISFAGYFLELFKWNRLNFQIGTRFELNSIKIPAATITGKYFPSDDKSINSISTSIGAVYSLSSYVSVFSNIANAFRAPTIEELASYAIHDATGSFDIGDRSLNKENNIGIDLGLRVRKENHSVELSAYYNNISNYIFRKPTGQFYDTGSDQSGNTIGLNFTGGFPVFRYSQADALIYGFEAKALYEYNGNMATTVIFDYTRGKIKGIDENLPQMPPLRFSLEQRYTNDHFWGGIVLKFANRQNLISPFETITMGYGLVDLFSGVRLITGRIVHMITVRVDNALNQPYRDHLSAIKDFALMPGRNFRINYKILF
jgi:iron complex outermembrane receptor protein